MSMQSGRQGAEREDELVLSPSEAAAHNSAMRIAGVNSGERSTRKALASIVLGFELIIVVLIGLTIFGLDLTEPRWLGLVIGGVLALLCVLALATMRLREVGIWLGWATHVLMLSTAFLLPAALFVGGIFTALWVYCLVRGSKIDRDNAALSAAG